MRMVATVALLENSRDGVSCDGKREREGEGRLGRMKRIGRYGWSGCLYRVVNMRCNDPIQIAA